MANEPVCMENIALSIIHDMKSFTLGMILIQRLKLNTCRV
jgi:hypothetical protein